MRTASIGPACLWHEGGRDQTLPPITVPNTVDLAVVGAGILGLTVARRAARSGLSVVVFDAQPLGHGASGLNGGQVIPGLKHDPDWLVAHFGTKQGQALATFAAGTADSVFDTIRHEGLDVPSERNGWIMAAHTQAAFQMCLRRARSLAGAPVEVLDATAVAAHTGVSGYVGGFLDRRAGTIQPFSYLSELARIASEAGVVLRTGCKVVRLDRSGGGWNLLTSDEPVQAAKVLIATNADADALVPGLARTILPLHSFQIATEHLPPEIAAEILPGGQAVSDSRRIVTYFRKSPDGRFVLGGRGTLRSPRGVADWRHLHRAMTRLYPQLAGTPVTHHWFGRVAITLDYLPHLHEPAPGLIAVLGCQGRGIGLMTALGRPVADYIASGDPTTMPLPITPIAPIPFHRFRHLGVAAAIAWYRMLDGLQR